MAVKGKTIDMTAPTGEAPEGIISTELSGKDVEFFTTAYEIGGLETWLGGQAKQRGEADKVKAVGDALQSTQVEENDLLQRLAKRKGVALPAAPAEAAAVKRFQAPLAKLSGPHFDKEVMEQIGEVAQQAVDAYTVAANSQDADIRHFAAQVLPMVNEKLALARRLSGKALPPGAKPGFRENALPPPPPAAATPPEPAGPPAISAPPVPAPPRPTPVNVKPPTKG